MEVKRCLKWRSEALSPTQWWIITSVQFELSDSERMVLQQIRAASLQGFAAQLDAWLKTRPIVAIGAE